MSQDSKQRVAFLANARTFASSSFPSLPRSLGEEISDGPSGVAVDRSRTPITSHRKGNSLLKLRSYRCPVFME
jgi:hypothetical protein